MHAYWLRVWGARGLLYAWHEPLEPQVCGALAAARRTRTGGSGRWSAKVVARRVLGDVLEPVLPLRDDPVERVRLAAGRAVVRITAAGA